MKIAGTMGTMNAPRQLVWRGHEVGGSEPSILFKRAEKIKKYKIGFKIEILRQREKVRPRIKNKLKSR